MTIGYIADTHWRHRNICSYDNRPFNSVDEMDEAMVSLWNETVSEDDLTYVDGDMVWSQKYEEWEELLGRLNGRVFVVKGNHDRTKILEKLAKNKVIEGFSHQEVISDGPDKVVLNHSPMPFFVNMHQTNWVHLYGHVHVSFDANMMLNMQRQISELYLYTPRMYNVGCMVPWMDYRPRTLKEIEEGFKRSDPLKLEFTKNFSHAERRK